MKSKEKMKNNEPFFPGIFVCLSFHHTLGAAKVVLKPTDSFLRSNPSQTNDTPHYTSDKDHSMQRLLQTRPSSIHNDALAPVHAGNAVHTMSHLCISPWDQILWFFSVQTSGSFRLPLSLWFQMMGGHQQRIHSLQRRCLTCQKPDMEESVALGTPLSAFHSQ